MQIYFVCREKRMQNNGGDFVKMTRNVQKLSKMTKICEKDKIIIQNAVQHMGSMLYFCYTKMT